MKGAFKTRECCNRKLTCKSNATIEINFNLIILPQDSVLHAIDLCRHLYSSVVHTDQYSLDSHAWVK